MAHVRDTMIVARGEKRFTFMSSLEDTTEGQIAVLSCQATGVRIICLQVGVACFVEGRRGTGVNGETDSFTTEPCEIESVTYDRRRGEELTVALVIAISIKQRHLDTTIKHLPKNSKTIALEEITRSLKLLSHDCREAGEIERYTKIRLHGRVVQITSCPTRWKVVDERRCDIEVECLMIGSRSV
jgi:hypothetical protein